jgi:hypothetical protein
MEVKAAMSEAATKMIDEIKADWELTELQQRAVLLNATRDVGKFMGL